MTTKGTYQQLAAASGLRFIRAITAKGGRKRPERQQRGKWNDPGQGFGAFDIDHRFKHREPQGAVPYHAGLAVVDIDCAPGHSKDDLRAMPKSAARGIIGAYVKQLAAEHEWFKRSIFCNYTASGFGMHYWFKYDNVNDAEFAQLKFGCGEILGKHFVVLYDPEPMARALYEAKQNGVPAVSRADLEALRTPPKSPKAIKSVKSLKKSSSHESQLDVKAMHERLGSGEAAGAPAVFRALQSAGIIGPATDITAPLGTKTIKAGKSKGKQARWSLKDIASEFGRFPLHYWHDRDFWLLAGMALHDVSGRNRPALKNIWDALSALSPKFDQADNDRTWNYFAGHSGKQISMGSVVFLAGLVNPRSPHQKQQETGTTTVEEFAAGLKLDAWRSTADIHQMYLASGGSLTRKAFSRRFREATTLIPAGRNGKAGWKPAPPPRTFVLPYRLVRRVDCKTYPNWNDRMHADDRALGWEPGSDKRQTLKSLISSPALWGITRAADHTIRIENATAPPDSDRGHVKTIDINAEYALWLDARNRLRAEWDADADSRTTMRDLNAMLDDFAAKIDNICHNYETEKPCK